MKRWLIKYYLKKYIHLVPVIMLIITLISNFIEINYVVAGNLIGYSILSNFFMWYHFNFTGSYCKISKRISFGLVLINMIDIFGEFIKYSYYTNIFNGTVCFVSLSFFLYYKFIKSFKRRI